MVTNLREIISRIRNESPLLGRNARQYIADALDALFTAHTSHYGESREAASAESKLVVNVTPAVESLRRGMRVSVHFTNTNTHPNPRLNVSNTGSMPISRLSNWAAGSTVEFVFDGSSWRLVGKQKGTANPLMDNVAAPGTDNGIYSASDHIHPAYVHHGVSEVSADASDKVVGSVIPAFNAGLLRQGARVSVQFANSNTEASPTLNVSGSGARPIVNLSNWAAGSTVDFVFDGVNWRMIGKKKTSDNDPLMDYVAEAGTDNGEVSRADHVHPAYVHHGICTSPAAAARKMVAEVVPAFDDKLLREGVRVTLQFIETNTHANPTLSISGTQPLPITNLSNWAAGSTVDFVFGNGSWRMVSAKKAGVAAPLVDLESDWSAGTDNGQLSNEDHQHILYIDHHTDHTTRGRFLLDRMPTSAVPNRVLAVGEANTSPAYQQANEEMIADNAVRTSHIQESAVTGEKIFSSEEDNMILRVNEAGTHPVWGKVNLDTDFEGVLPVDNGGTGADNPFDARWNLEVMWYRSPITGGRMVKRAVDHTRVLTEAWDRSGSTAADIEGWVPGAFLTDAQIVFPNGVCFPTGIGIRANDQEQSILTLPRYVQGSVIAVGFGNVSANEGRLLFTMHLPLEATGDEEQFGNENRENVELFEALGQEGEYGEAQSQDVEENVQVHEGQEGEENMQVKEVQLMKGEDDEGNVLCV
jgi:hypothetical protein